MHTDRNEQDKATRRARGYAAKLKAEGVGVNASDETIAAHLAHCVRTPRLDMYPLIREELRGFYGATGRWHGPQLPTIQWIRAWNAKQATLGACVIPPLHWGIEPAPAARCVKCAVRHAADKPCASPMSSVRSWLTEAEIVGARFAADRGIGED